MTYRRFTLLYAAARKEATPDISLPAADPRPRAKFAPRAALAAVAAVAVLAGGVLLWRAPKNDLPAAPTSPTGPVSSPSTEPTGLPTRPQPGQIPINETVRVIPALHAGTPLAELATSDTPTTVTETFVFPYTDTAREDHADCTGVYYNAADGALFCCTHAARELLKKQGLPGRSVRVKCFLPTYGLLLFTLEDVKGHPSYCADLKTGALHRIDVDLYQSGTSMGGVMQELGTVPCALVFVTGDRKDSLYLIDLQAVTARTLSDAYPAMDDYRFTREGSYVVYTLNGEHANDPGRTTVLYRIADGSFQTFTGEVLDELPDDSLFVIRTPDGVRAYDPAAEETRPLSVLPEGYRRGVSVTDRYTSYGSECHLQTTDYQTGETHTLTTPYLSAWARSADRRTLYYYVRGEDQIHILDLVTGDEQVTAADDRLAEETETGDVSARAVWFTLTVLPEEQLLLEYGVTDAPREDPEAIRQELENDVSWQYARWREANPDPTVASMGDLLKRFPREGIAAYQGEGYLYLDYTGLFTGSQNRRILFEDYRTGLGYQILHDWNDLHAPFHLTGKDRTGYLLPAGAQAAALQALTDAGIPILPAQRDYGVYFTHGVPDMLAVLQDSLKAEVLLPRVGCYFLHVPDRDTGEARWGLYVAEDMWDFWRFTDSLDYRYLGNSDEYGQYLSYNEYSVDLGAIHLFMGIRNGKPFLMRMNEVASISKKDYETWTAWIRKKWPEQFVDPLVGE